MGTRGRRNQTLKQFEEPILLSNIDKVKALAVEKNLYNGDVLDIEQLIEEISHEAPVDAQISIEKIPMENYLSGSLSYENGRWIMKVNSKQHINRQRFTLAHELAHYILHKDKNTEFKDSTFFRGNNMDSLEYMANDYASALLMPDDKVIGYINDGVRKLDDLASKFEVSVAAMKYKVEKLGYKVR